MTTLTCRQCGRVGEPQIMHKAPEGVGVRPGTILCATCCRQVVDAIGDAESTALTLTPREREVADLLREGVTDNARLAARLGVSIDTAKNYRAMVRSKTRQG